MILIQLSGLYFYYGTPIFALVESYPFRQLERVFFNPYNQNEMWVTSFGNGLKVGTMKVSGQNEITFDKSKISVYPNPFNEIICFTNSDVNNHVIKINVYDFDGRLLISKRIENKSVNTSR